MPKTDPVLAKMREICLSLPDTKETLTWGEPHFRVGEKIFAGCGGHKGKQKIGFKLTKPHADAAVEDPRFERAPYVGKHGWVSMDPSGISDWSEVRAMILESYSLIASKDSLAKLGKKPAPARARAKGRTPRKKS
jgi:predicted DNA-binding protein (MmcQ/YjbR family)